MTSDGIAIFRASDRDGVIVYVPDARYTHLGQYTALVDVELDWRHLRELRDKIIEFLGDNQ